MSNSNGIITAPIDIESDVASVLGVNSSDLGELCTSNKINMWSKFKPVPVNNPNETIINSNWWKGTDNLCGLNIPTASGSPDSIYNSAWSYKILGSDNWKELLSFEGYNHNSTFPLTGWLPSSDVSLQKPNSILYVKCAILKPTPKNNLQVTDCDLLSNLRLACKIDVAGKSFIQTSDKKASEVVNDSGILQVAINFDELQYGTSAYVITQFFTTSSYPSITAFPSVITCYSVPNYYSGSYANRINVKYNSREPGLSIVCEGMAYNIQATYYSGDYYYSNPFAVNPYTEEYWKLTLDNQNTSEYRLRNTDIKWYAQDFADKDVTDDYNRNLKLYNSSKQSVAELRISAGSKVTAYVKTKLLSQLIGVVRGVRTGICYGMLANTGAGSSSIVGRFEMRANISN